MQYLPADIINHTLLSYSSKADIFNLAKAYPKLYRRLRFTLTLTEYLACCVSCDYIALIDKYKNRLLGCYEIIAYAKTLKMIDYIWDKASLSQVLSNEEQFKLTNLAIKLNNSRFLKLYKQTLNHNMEYTTYYHHICLAAIKQNNIYIYQKFFRSTNNDWMYLINLSNSADTVQLYKITLLHTLNRYHKPVLIYFNGGKDRLSQDMWAGFFTSILSRLIERDNVECIKVLSRSLPRLDISALNIVPSDSKIGQWLASH
jgi:hypothetical protein